MNSIDKALHAILYRNGYVPATMRIDRDGKVTALLRGVDDTTHYFVGWVDEMVTADGDILKVWYLPN